MFGIKYPLNMNKRDATTNWSGPDDTPELTVDFFEQADEFIGDRLVRRGRLDAKTTQQSLPVRCH